MLYEVWSKNFQGVFFLSDNGIYLVCHAIPHEVVTLQLSTVSLAFMLFLKTPEILCFGLGKCSLWLILSHDSANMVLWVWPRNIASLFSGTVNPLHAQRRPDKFVPVWNACIFLFFYFLPPWTCALWIYSQDRNCEPSFLFICFVVSMGRCTARMS